MLSLWFRTLDYAPCGPTRWLFILLYIRPKAIDFGPNGIWYR